MADVLSAMTPVYTFIIGMFQNIISMIMANPLVFTPVILAILGGVIMFAIGLVRKFGIKGLSSSGRKGRRRRR